MRLEICGRCEQALSIRTYFHWHGTLLTSKKAEVVCDWVIHITSLRVGSQLHKTRNWGFHPLKFDRIRAVDTSHTFQPLRVHTLFRN